MSRAEKIICGALLFAVTVYVASEFVFWHCAAGQPGSRLQVPGSRDAPEQIRNSRPAFELDSPREFQPIAARRTKFQVPSSKSEAKNLESGTWNLEPREALAEVNALRRARGLRPFVFDEALSRGAKNVAQFRARRLIEGHTADDFRGLPRGVRADAAGCAAWHGNDWGSCCTYENYRFAGAAWCRGRDGRRYMHLFVRR